MNIEQYIAIVEDYPVKGVTFRDITPLLKSPEGFYELVEEWSLALKDIEANKILATEARGFVFAAPIAIALGLPLILVRKKGKLPKETVSIEYALEYGTDSLFVHKDDIEAGDKIIIIDDILATGGTANATCSLVEKCGGEVASCSFMLELDGLNGRENLRDRNLLSLYHA
ncbi:MAG: adenine phosphoribosyltransferase [Opitutales bacterium]